MRLPHHLTRHHSGIFHFRYAVPADLRERLRLRVIKRSTRTRDPRAALAQALVWSAGYAWLFARLRSTDMPKDFDVDGWLKGDLPRTIRPFELDLERGTIKTDGTAEDRAAAMETVKIMTAFKQASAAAPATAPPSPMSNATLRAAIDHWAVVEKTAMRNKQTAEAREKIIENFADHIGETRPIASLSKLDVASWVAYRRNSRKNHQSTAKKNAGDIKALFESAQRAGFYPDDRINPADNAVKFTKRDQADRSETHGWQAFTDDQITTLFHPDSLKRTREIHTRRAMVIALYTGARVGEIAQLRLKGFSTIDGQPVMIFTGETKTDKSKRQLPIHPELIEFGLMDWVEDQRRRGFTRLFPTVKLDGKSGKGNAISKGMGNLLNLLGIKPWIDPDLALTKELDPKIGMHSFRSTVIQAMQGHTDIELRKAYVGHKHERHEPEQTSDRDSHETAYMRKWTTTEVARVFKGISWWPLLDFAGVRALLSQTDEEHAKAMKSTQFRELTRSRTTAKKAGIAATEVAKKNRRKSKKLTQSPSSL